MLTMGAFPRACTAAIRRREDETKGAHERLERTVVMKTDGRLLFRCELVPAVRKDVDAATTVTTSVTSACLAKVVKESHDRDAVSREPARVDQHMVVYLDSVRSESAVLLVVAIAATREIG